jgi:pyroglutamyl-peptidase
LITGFDAFGDHQFNPSQAVVEALPDELSLRKFKVKVPLHPIVLPSSGENAWHALHRAILESPPNAILAILLAGLADRRSYITLERFALNIKDYPILDNDGHRRRGERIDEYGPEAMRTSVDLEAIVRRQRRRGLPAEISNYAGSFVCNETYYRTLLLGSRNPSEHRILFVHLPPLSKIGKALKESKQSRLSALAHGRANQLQATRESIIDIAAELCEQLVLA